MKIVVIALAGVLSGSIERPAFHRCDPYAAECPACRDCSRCRACHIEHNRCSVCRWK